MIIIIVQYLPFIGSNITNENSATWNHNQISKYLFVQNILSELYCEEREMLNKESPQMLYVIVFQDIVQPKDKFKILFNILNCTAFFNLDIFFGIRRDISLD